MQWTDEACSAFLALKDRIKKPPVLVFPNYDRPFEVMVDASRRAVGAVLMQADEDGKRNPMQFASRKLTPAETNYSTFEQEEVAVVFSLKKFRYFLLNDAFVVHSGHQALRTAFAKRDVHGRIARWLNLMAEYRFEIKHIPGRECCCRFPVTCLQG